MQTLQVQPKASIASPKAHSRRQLRLGVVCAAKQQQKQQAAKGSNKVEYGANWCVYLQAPATRVLAVSS